MSIPLERVQAWLFDLDGTLMDAGNHVVEAVAGQIPLLGPALSRHLARQLVLNSDVPLNALTRVLQLAGREHWVYALRRRFRRNALPIFPPFPRVTELLEWLSARSKVGIVTSRSHRDAKTFLRRYGLEGPVTAIVSEESVRYLKPHPEPVHEAARQLGVSPEQCVLVGDMPVDMRAARRAGAWAIGVLCGMGRERELRRAGAQLLLTTVSELTAHLAAEQ